MPFIQANTLRTHYHIHGEGLPIIFVSAPLLTYQNFHYQMDQITPGIQVITYDVRGHGQSEPSAVPITIPLLVEDVKQLLHKLGVRRCCIAGYSTGAMVALEAMLTFPDLFSSGILISGMSEVSDWWLRTKIHAAIVVSRLRTKQLLARAISWGNATDMKMYRLLHKDAVQGHLQNMKEYYQTSLSFNCTSRLQAIRQPVLLLYGEKDKGFRRYANILQRHLPHNELVFIPEARHQLPTKNAVIINRIINNWVMRKLQ